MRKTNSKPRRAWRRRGRAGRRPGKAATGNPSMAEALQLAIGLLTASLDSPQLQAQVMEAMIPDREALANLLAGLHLVSQMLLRELHCATGQPPAATLQRLAILAQTSRDTRSTGQSGTGQSGTG